tara:strand:- start:1939 stop:2349 length:411 start_codon:yes stop_codon:yes gene_type:complete
MKVVVEYSGLKVAIQVDYEGFDTKEILNKVFKIATKAHANTLELASNKVKNVIEDYKLLFLGGIQARDEEVLTECISSYEDYSNPVVIPGLTKKERHWAHKNLNTLAKEIGKKIKTTTDETDESTLHIKIKNVDKV